MELPGVGKQCGHNTCNSVDFLSFKCTYCDKVFCDNHWQADKHGCDAARARDVRAHVCPLCKVQLPVRRDEDPNVTMDRHISEGCLAPKPKKSARTGCGKPGCKLKELIMMNCDQCHGKFCIKHRYPADHECGRLQAGVSSAKASAAQSRAAQAAMQRHQRKAAASQSTRAAPTARTPSAASTGAPSHYDEEAAMAAAIEASLTQDAQGGISEDEALARAMQASLAEENARKRPARKAEESTCAMA